MTIRLDASAAYAGTHRVGAAMPERDEFIFELKEMLGTIGRRKRWIGVSMAICAALAFLAIGLSKPVYKSSAQILVDPRGVRITDNDIVPRAQSSDAYDAIIDTQVRLATSGSVLRAVVERLGLAGDPSFETPAATPAPDEAEPSGQAAGSSREVERAVATLRRNLTVEREGKSFFVTIMVAADSADKATHITSAIVSELLSKLESMQHGATSSALESLGASLKTQRDRLIEAETAVERYKSSHGIVDSDGQALNAGRLTELNLQLLTAHNATLALAARLQQVQPTAESALVASRRDDSLDSPVLTHLRASYAEVERQRNTLVATLGASHPQMQEIDAQAKGLLRSIAQELARLSETVRSDHAAAVAREAALRRSLEDAERQTDADNQPLVALRELQREALAHRSVYEKTLERERQLEEQQTVGAPATSVVSASKLISEPAALRGPLLVAAALALGALAGTALVLVRERLDGKVHSPGRLVARTGLDVLGLVPLPKSAGSAEATPMQSVLRNHNGSTAASRAMFRTVDALDNVASRNVTILMVVSASGGPARAAISANLAFAETLRGRRTLLLDADEAHQGLAKALMPAPLLEAPVQSCTLDGHPSVSLAVSTLEAGQQLSASPESCDQVFAGFQRVVIDVGFPIDEIAARALADRATAVVIVAETGVSSFEQIGDIQRMLARHAKIIGTLLVNPGPPRPSAPLAAAA